MIASSREGQDVLLRRMFKEQIDRETERADQETSVTVRRSVVRWKAVRGEDARPPATAPAAAAAKDSSLPLSFVV